MHGIIFSRWFGMLLIRVIRWPSVILAKFFFVCFARSSRSEWEANERRLYSQVSLWNSTSSWSINTQKETRKKERRQYPAILPSRLFNEGLVARHSTSIPRGQDSVILPAERASHIIAGTNNLVLLISASTNLPPNNTSPPAGTLPLGI